jgi:3'-5' exoribonuclease
LLADRTGEIIGILWEGFDEAERTIQPGDFVQVKAFVGSYQGSLELNVAKIEKLDPREVNREEFSASTQRDVGDMMDYLRGVSISWKDPHLKELMNLFWGDESFVTVFKVSPAAKGLHHVYLGGLLEHTTSVVELCEAIIGHYEGIDRDLLLAGALLHDVGKVKELCFDKGIPDYTDQGRLLGHIVIGSHMVEEKILSLPDFPNSLKNELLHIIISHHGEHAWGSPKRPKTIEALIVHHVEDLDAKMTAFQQFMIQSKDPQRPRWTIYHKVFDRYLYLGEAHDEGLRGGTSSEA